MKQTLRNKHVGITSLVILTLGSIAINHARAQKSDDGAVSETQIRAKIDDAKKHLRFVAVACEAFFVDMNAYPVHTFEQEKSINGSAQRACPTQDWSAPAFRRAIDTGSGRDIFTITTPISYLTHIPRDPFRHDKTQKDCTATFAFYSLNEKDRQGWMAWSTGPDGDYDLDWKKYDGYGKGENNISSGVDRRFIDQLYDPTNGLMSNGDIARFKQ